MQAMTLENIESVLKFSKIGYRYVNECKISGFSREIEFWVEGEKYKIVWYKNLSTLYRNKLEVRFHNIRIYEYFGRFELFFKYNKNEVAIIRFDRGVDV